MKTKVNNLLDWFEKHFNFIIELLALIGGIFCILFSIVLFIVMLIDTEFFTDLTFGIIIIPGLMGFAGVCILFALRITRFLTSLNDKKE